MQFHIGRDNSNAKPQIVSGGIAGPWATLIDQDLVDFNGSPGPIHVIFASDENYAPHLGVHIRAIAETTNHPLHIHVLEKQISAASKAAIRDCVSDFDFSISVDFIGVDFPHAIGEKTPKHINEVTLYRLMAPGLLPHVERAIYIDVDAITVKPLSGLWITPLQGNPLALVESPWRRYSDGYKKKIGLGPNDPYFNAGTMIMDLAQMRDEDIQKQFLDCFFAKRDDLEHLDQDIMNIVLRGRITPIHPEWSVVRALYYYDGQGTLTYGVKEVEEAKRSPAIVQFSGAVKPWHPNDRHPLGYHYNEVRQRSPWRVARSGSEHTATERPKVSVIMATRNGASTLPDAVISILNQTLEDFEFIIVDDGSTDGTPELLRSLVHANTRISTLTNKTSIGLAASLNRGLDIAKGRYIARMDDDDISEPTRLEKQVAFLDSNPHVHVCGTNATVIRPFWHEPKEYDPAPPEFDKTIKVEMLRRPGLLHPTVMMRGAYIRAKQVRYDPSFLKGQDYELWTRLAFDHGAIFHNLQEPLLRYRAKMSDPREIRMQQENASYKIIVAVAKRLGFTEDDPLDLHARWLTKKLSQAEQKKRSRDIDNHVKAILDGNRKMQPQPFDQATLEAKLMEPYKEKFKDFHKEGSAGIKRYENFPLKSYLNIPAETLASFKKQAHRIDRRNRLMRMPVVGFAIRMAIAVLYPEKVFGKMRF